MLKKKKNDYDLIVFDIVGKEFMDLEGLKKRKAIVYDVQGILAGCDSRL